MTTLAELVPDMGDVPNTAVPDAIVCVTVEFPVGVCKVNPFNNPVNVILPSMLKTLLAKFQVKLLLPPRAPLLLN